MRILWITPGFAAHEEDHNCIPPLQMLARELVRRGVDLRVVALEYPFVGPTPSPSPPGEGGLLSANIWLHHLGMLMSLRRDKKNGNLTLNQKLSCGQAPLPWGGGDGGGVYPCNGQNRRWLRWRTHARARRFAQQLFSEKPFEAIHSFWLGPAWAIGEQMAKRWNIPHYCTLMGQDVLPGNRYLKRLKPEHTRQLVALSTFHNAMLQSSCGIRAAHCVPWGIEAPEFSKPMLAKRPIDILGVGSLVPVKNWARWLRVLRRVADSHPRFNAELIGGGPEQKRLQALVNRYQLSNQVQLSGELPRPLVLERMRQSRVLLHTANFESFGFVFSEAAASGCRVVSTTVGAAPTLGTCADTDEGLAEALIRAMELGSPKTPRVLMRMEDVGERYLGLYGGNSVL